MYLSAYIDGQTEGQTGRQVGGLAVTDRLVDRAKTGNVNSNGREVYLQVKTFRDLYSKAISDKLEDIMARFGAILAQGIIDAGH